MNYDALCDRMTELLDKPDADDDDSETAAQIADVEKHMREIEMAEADKIEEGIRRRRQRFMDLMSRIIPDDHVPFLIAQAKQATCAKDRRAAALVTPANILLLSATNGPPPGFACRRDEHCRATCGKYAVHAEMRALLVGQRHFQRAEMLHLRIDEHDQPMSSREPRCPECTKHMLEAGITALWLLTEGGWQRWPMLEAHELSLKNRGLLPCGNMPQPTSGE